MVIILKDITKKFRNTTAVKGLSVEIREGELVCLLGLWEKHHTFHDCGFGTAYKRRYFF